MISERPVSVLIVDDSAVARAALARIVDGERELYTVGAVEGAAQAIAWLANKRADVILLDIDMPGRTGLSALPDLIAAGEGAQILIVSSAAAEGAEATLSALALGAADTLAKPALGGIGKHFGAILAERVMRLGRARVHEASERIALRPTSTAPVGILAIGSSTGGIKALAAFFQHLPSTFTAPILITQHLPSAFMPYFAGQIAAMAKRPARVAEEGTRIARNQVLIAPGTAHLLVDRDRSGLHVRLSDDPAPTRCCPSVDPMLASVAATHGSRGTAVMLSGMGHDGLAGAVAVANAGGQLIVQDKGSSAVWGMPGGIARAGLASLVARPARLAEYLGHRGST